MVASNAEHADINLQEDILFGAHISNPGDISPLDRKTITHRVLSQKTRKAKNKTKSHPLDHNSAPAFNSISDTYTIFMWVCVFFSFLPFLSVFACFRPRDYLFIRQLKRGPQTNGPAIHLVPYRSLLVIENLRERRG